MKINIKLTWIFTVWILLCPTFISAIVLKNNLSTIEYPSLVSTASSDQLTEMDSKVTITRKRFPIISAIGLAFFGLTLIFHKFKQKNLKWLALGGFAAGTILGIIQEGLTLFSIINLSLWAGLFLGLIIWALVRNRFNKRKN